MSAKLNVLVLGGFLAIDARAEAFSKRQVAAHKFIVARNIANINIASRAAATFAWSTLEEVAAVTLAWATLQDVTTLAAASRAWAAFHTVCARGTAPAARTTAQSIHARTSLSAAFADAHG
eukprot:CAMPEP_0183345538 /NCGR_PEP_ID=MMETSP0164_2-20130417/10936_1 /TAXON_ID=221442 /ORGANISM="Coccolithus pelagicus ssp braarudi, Strain PLY182g" /LENGTH=120 /DNA_ID=CAMNT_0025516689 /DNA_START=231 /DNA_END=593 /DNA_ORIENTATION=-